jgi:hypothetical protein
MGRRMQRSKNSRALSMCILISREFDRMHGQTVGEWRGLPRVLETAQHACICTYSDGNVDAMIMTTQLTTVSMHACFDE